MKKDIFRFGIYGFILLVVLSLAEYIIFRDALNFEMREIFGYSSIFLSLLFVFFGIRHYRDHYQQGHLTFGQGMKLGLGITIFPALAFGLFTILYVTVVDPGFSDEYYAYELEKARKSMSAEEFQTKSAEMEKYKPLMNNLVFQFGLMFLTVFLIGVIMTVVSSLILMRKKSVN